jgi:hypothetical protein
MAPRPSHVVIVNGSAMVVVLSPCISTHRCGDMQISPSFDGDSITGYCCVVCGLGDACSVHEKANRAFHQHVDNVQKL